MKLQLDRRDEIVAASAAGAVIVAWWKKLLHPPEVMGAAVIDLAPPPVVSGAAAIALAPAPAVPVAGLSLWGQARAARLAQEARLPAPPDAAPAFMRVCSVKRSW